MDIAPGIYQSDDHRVRTIISTSVQVGANDYVFVDCLKDQTFRMLPCTQVFRLPSDIQRIDFFHSPQYGWSLALDGELQLTEFDESYYHRALVIPALEAASADRECKRIIIIGGGDGCAVREILNRSEGTFCTVVDHDPNVVAAFQVGDFGNIFNTKAALNDPRVNIVYQNYVNYLKQNQLVDLDLIIIDLTDYWSATVDCVIGLFDLMHATGNIGRYVGAQLGPSRLGFIPDLRQRLRNSDIALLAYWEKAIPSFGDTWSFGLFGRCEGASAPNSWAKSFPYGGIKLLAGYI